MSDCVLRAVGPEERPSGVLAGPVNHCSPVPDTRMPKSVPLRAIVVTMRARDAAASVASLHAGIPRLRKKCSFAPEKRTASSDIRPVGRDQVRKQLAEQHQRAGAVTVVAPVAHLQHLR